jgi:hypothetical protein
MAETEVVKLELPNGAVVFVEVQLFDREEDISGGGFRFADVKEQIIGIAHVAQEAISEIKPKSASVEFGLEVGLESGAITALLAKGTGKANLKIKLEW